MWEKRDASIRAMLPKKVLKWGVCVYIYYMHTCTHMYPYMFVYLYIYIQAYADRSIDRSIDRWMDGWIDLCVCTYIYICAYIHI